MSVASVKAFLVWKDGRRQPHEWRGENSVRVHDIGTMTETTFVVDASADWTESEPLLFVERSARDIRKDMAEARRRNDEQTMAVVSAGLGWGHADDTWAQRLRRRFANWVRP